MYFDSYEAMTYNNKDYFQVLPFVQLIYMGHKYIYWDNAPDVIQGMTIYLE